MLKHYGKKPKSVPNVGLQKNSEDIISTDRVTSNEVVLEKIWQTREPYHNKEEKISACLGHIISHDRYELVQLITEEGLNIRP